MDKDQFVYLRDFVLIENISQLPKEFFSDNDMDYNKRHSYCIKWWFVPETDRLILSIYTDKGVVPLELYTINNSLRLKKYLIKREYYNDIINTKKIMNIETYNNFKKLQKMSAVSSILYNFRIENIKFSDGCSIKLNDDYKINENINLSVLNHLKNKNGGGIFLHVGGFENEKTRYYLKDYCNELAKKINKKWYELSEDDYKLIEMLII